MNLIQKFCGVLLLALSVANQAAASECELPSQPDDVAGAFRHANQQRCFGDDSDTTAITAYIDVLLAKYDSAMLEGTAAQEGKSFVATAQLAAILRQGAAGLRTYLSGIPQSEDAETAARVLDRSFERMVEHADALIWTRQDVAGVPKSVLAPLTNAANFSPAGGKDNPLLLLSKLDGSVPNFSVVAHLKARCATVDARACGDELERVGALFRTAKLAGRLVQGVIAKANLDAIASEVAVLDRQWSAYFEQARSQTLIEYFVNAWCWNGGRAQALPPPPTGQWIVLHPGAALEYIGGGPSSDRFKPVVYLDVIGYSWLDYRDDGSLRKPRGLALGLVYVDREESRDVRPMVQAHYGRYELGLTLADGDLGVMLSADLLDITTALSGSWKDAVMAGIRGFD